MAEASQLGGRTPLRKKTPTLPLGAASPGDYLLEEEALPTPSRISSMQEMTDLESQCASELESYGDATFGPIWTGQDLVEKPKLVKEAPKDDTSWDPAMHKAGCRVTPREDVRIDGLERGCVKLRRDVRTVWILERTFEERMSQKVSGWHDDIRDMRDKVVTDINEGQKAVVREAMAEESERLNNTINRAIQCEAENAMLRDRCSMLEARVADLSDAEKRLNALEARCALSEANHTTLIDDVERRDGAASTSIERHRDRIRELSLKARANSGRLTAVEKLARPAYDALAMVRDRMAAVARCDDAAAVSAKRPGEARAMAADFVADDDVLGEGDRGSGLLMRLSRPGAGGGEFLGQRRGVNLDAAILADQRAQRIIADRSVAEAPAPAPQVTGAATLTALEPHLRAIFDRVGASGDGEISLAEAVQALREDEDFAEVLGFEGATQVKRTDGTKDRLGTALQKMDADGDKTISWAEFRRATLGDEAPVVEEEDDLGGCLDEDLGSTEVEDLLPSVIGDAILATYRRLDGLERSKADEEFIKSLEDDIKEANSFTDTVEKRLLERLAKDTASTSDRLDSNDRHLEGLHEVNGATCAKVEDMIKAQTELKDTLSKMDNDSLSAVRDYLAPTVRKVEETAATLEKFSFTTEFKLTELHEKKETKKRVDRMAEQEVVDLKAEQKDLEATTALVNVLNRTLAEALKRLARSEDQIKPLKKATASLNTAVRDLRRNASSIKKGSTEEPAQPTATSHHEDERSETSTRQSRDRSLPDLPDHKPAFPPFPKSARPSSPVHDNAMLHNMRMTWSRDGQRRDGSPHRSKRLVGFEDDIPFVEDDPPRRVIPRRVKAPLGDARKQKSPWVDKATKERDERLARDYPRSRTPTAAGNIGGL
jgi:hypothetical protein